MSTNADDAELHNAGFDETVGEVGACGRVHLPNGQTCTLQRRHDGTCDFSDAADVVDSIASHRAADGW